jgi:hypothetical protein
MAARSSADAHEDELYLVGIGDEDQLMCVRFGKNSIVNHEPYVVGCYSSSTPTRCSSSTSASSRQQHHSQTLSQCTPRGRARCRSPCPRWWRALTGQGRESLNVPLSDKTQCEHLDATRTH